MIEQQKKQTLAAKIAETMRQVQQEGEDWIPFARLGCALVQQGVDYKEYGFKKLRPFLNEFEDMLAFQDVTEEGKPPVCYVRMRQPEPSVPKREEEGREEKNRPRLPEKDMRLYDWAFVHFAKLGELAQLCLPEKWYYGSRPEPGREYAILSNYLDYTFRRLHFEGKIAYQKDPVRGTEYAAFNTGLVDRKYEYIYALLACNLREDARQYWFLMDFVVAGEDLGKMLVSLFNPLPQRADYFENRIENMLYDSSTGALSCDYTHMLTERVYRLPMAFLEDNCPADMLEIGGMTLQEACGLPGGQKKADYFRELGERIRTTPRILNRLKNRMADAVALALKKVEWNYKTAIPTYYPKNNSGSLLLPLALADEEHVDLALVVERQPSGSYQGQTILPLDLAYSNSRLVARPDSDWLQTDGIVTTEPGEGE